MATRYVRQEPAECVNCGGPAARRKPSESGSYYCGAKDCQAARHKVWYQRKRVRNGLDDQHEAVQIRDNLLKFLWASHRAPRVPCPECGLTNALMGWRHRDSNDSVCLGTDGQAYIGVGPQAIDSVWAFEDRKYETPSMPLAPAR